MKRYKKANEDIHAPEEVKEKAVRPAGKRPYARWMGAVAAVLALALVGGIAMRPGQSDGPVPLSGHDPRTRDGGALSAHALALADYPEMAPIPPRRSSSPSPGTSTGTSTTRRGRPGGTAGRP